MSLQQDLMSIEKSLWKGGGDAFRENLDDTCLVAFPQMAGVRSLEEVVDSTQGTKRWQDPKFQFEGVLQPTEDVALLTYRATSSRPEGEPYKALVSSGYIRRDGSWKLMFHQQTPLSA